jgi:hypothetical protein
MSNFQPSDIEAAAKRLRPNAEFKMLGHTFTEWKDLTGQQKPSWEELVAEIKRVNG